jgi:hypothetical protein
MVESCLIFDGKDTQSILKCQERNKRNHYRDKNLDHIGKKKKKKQAYKLRSTLVIRSTNQAPSLSLSPSLLSLHVKKKTVQKDARLLDIAGVREGAESEGRERGLGLRRQREGSERAQRLQQLLAAASLS